MIRKFLIVFAVVWIYKFVNSILNLINMYRYKRMYYDFLHRENVEQILQNKTAVIELFKKAGVKNMYFPVSQAVGYGQVANFNASVFDTFPSKINIMVPATFECFFDAIGILKRNILECFNPLYWIRSVLFLPQKVLIYLNVSADSIFIKIVQLIYWALGLLFTLFSSDIAKWIKSFIHF